MPCCDRAGDHRAVKLIGADDAPTVPIVRIIYIMETIPIFSVIINKLKQFTDSRLAP